MLHRRAAESHRGHPRAAIRSRVIEPALRLDQHVQAHKKPESIPPPIVIDDRVEHDERPAVRKRLVRLRDEPPLFVEVPVVEDVSHDENIPLWERIREEVPRLEAKPLLQTERGNVLFEDGANAGQVVPNPGQVRMGEGELYGKPALRGAQVDERAVVPPRELLRYCDGEPHAEPRHSLEKRLQAGGVRVEGREQVLSFLDLVLGPPGPQGLRKGPPEGVQTGIRHLEHPTEVRRLRSVEEQFRVRRVLVASVMPLEHVEGYKGIEKVPRPPRVQPEAFRKGFGAEGSLREFCEHAELHRRQQDLRSPETQPEVHQPIRRRSFAHAIHLARYARCGDKNVPSRSTSNPRRSGTVNWRREEIDLGPSSPRTPVELEGGRVEAVPQPGRLGPVLEYVPKMGTAIGALDFGPS